MQYWKGCVFFFLLQSGDYVGESTRDLYSVHKEMRSYFSFLSSNVLNVNRYYMKEQKNSHKWNQIPQSMLYRQITRFVLTLYSTVKAKSVHMNMSC